MIKYCICCLSDQCERFDEEKRVFIPAWKLLYITTWDSLEEAKKALKKVRAAFPAMAQDIYLDSFIA